MDLSTIEGLNLTEEQKTAIMTAHQTGIDAATTGLVNKNNDLTNVRVEAYLPPHVSCAIMKY